MASDYIIVSSITETEKNTMFFSGLNLTIPRQPTKPPA
jgi:hypothetical protein